MVRKWVLKTEILFYSYDTGTYIKNSIFFGKIVRK